MLREAWKITMLGNFQAVEAENVLERFRTRKTAALLAYLAYYNQRVHTREELAALHWPEAKPELSLKSLGVALCSLRHSLEPPETTTGSVLMTDRRTVRLCPEAVQTDVSDFRRNLQAAQAAVHSHARRDHLERAIASYGGDLMPGFYEEWIFPERAQLAHAYQQALQELAALLEAAEFSTQAVSVALKQMQVDPYDEAACARLMRLCHSLGQVSNALHHYETLERRLALDLNLPPQEELQQLAGRLRGELTIPLTLSPILPQHKHPSEGRPPSADFAPQCDAPKRIVLPLPLTRFFGREQEQEQLIAWLNDPSCRLITLTGLGGSGKTRLAIETVRQFALGFPGRILFVPLADLSAASQVVEAIKAALKLPEHSQHSSEIQIAQSFAEIPFLLILDNLEHLLPVPGETVPSDGLSALVLSLLQQARSLKVLTTSRHPLGIAGEQEFPVLPLPIPNQYGLPKNLIKFASVQLFADRLRLRQPDFQVTPHNASAVARLCARLDGIPLALELAAGWARTLPISRLLESMQTNLGALASQQKGVPERHRTLWAMMDSSYQLLPLFMQRFFARLSVFRGGWTAETAAQVCGEECALEYLDRLAACSLVQTEQNFEETRYRFLETVREFADKMLVGEERRQTLEQHAVWMTDLADAARADAQKEVARHRLFMEAENLRAVLLRECKAKGDGGRVLRLLLAADGLMIGSVNFNEVRYWLGHTLRDRPVADASLRAESLLHIARMEMHENNTSDARAFIEQAERVYAAMDDRQGRARALIALCDLELEAGNEEMAKKYFQDCEKIVSKTDDKQFTILLLQRQAYLALFRSDVEAAGRCYEKVLELQRALGDSKAIAHTCICLAENASKREHYAVSKRLAEECLWRAREAHHGGLTLWAIAKMAQLALWNNEFDVAARYWEEWLTLAADALGVSWIALGWAERAHIALKQGQRDLARDALLQALSPLQAGSIQFLSAVARIAAILALETDEVETAIGLLSFGQDAEYEKHPYQRREQEAIMNQLRVRCGNSLFAALWAEGKGLSTAEVIRHIEKLLFSSFTNSAVK